MCWWIFDLFLFIFDYDNMGHECGAGCQWCLWSWNLVQLIRGHCMSSFVILSHNEKKLVKGQLWAEVIQVMIWGHVKVLPIASWVIWDNFFGYHISFCYFFVLELMRGHDFWVQFEMCWWIFDLFPLILNNGTVSVKWGHKWHWCPW